MSNLPVYEHVEKIVIPSNHGADVNYIVLWFR